MKAPEELTLTHIKNSVKTTERNFRVSDFVSKEEMDELHRINAIGKQEKPKFDEIDAFEAEIIARFGYEVFKDWENGAVTPKRMNKWILAERSREARKSLALKAMIANGFAGCANHDKNGKPPKTSKNIQKIMKEEINKAKGSK